MRSELMGDERTRNGGMKNEKNESQRSEKRNVDYCKFRWL